MIDLDCRIKSGNDKKKICLIWIAGSKPGDDNKKTQPAMTCMAGARHTRSGFSMRCFRHHNRSPGCGCYIKGI